MERPNASVSLTDLSAAGVRLRPYEAATLVRELVLQVTRGEVAGVPSAHVVRLSASGAVTVEGPVAADGRSVSRAAQLLDSLLPPADTGGQFRVPGGLRLVLARAAGSLDLPPFPSLESFAESLSRFTATEPAAMVTNLVESWSEAVEKRLPGPAPAEPRPALMPAPGKRFVANGPDELEPAASDAITVSDIRRARRATGMPLVQVAERSRIPLGLLRQLEWGYLANWPSGHYGRTQLIRYARATGLDEQLVVSAIAPLLAHTEPGRATSTDQGAAAATPAAAAVRPSEIVVEVEDLPLAAPVLFPTRPASRMPVRAERARPSRTGAKALASLAIPALLALGILPVWWAQRTASPAPDDPTAAVEPAVRRGPGAPEPEPRASAAAGVEPAAGSPSATGADAAPADERPAVDAEPAYEEAERPAYRLVAADAAFSPSFASAGSAMFYHDGDDRTGGSALIRADTDSRGSTLRITRIVDDSANNFHVRPSPDGTRIAFDSDRGGVRGVYVADADGRNVRRVSPEGFAAVPSWSPDGSMLAFVRAEDGQAKVWNLWTLDLATGELAQVTRHRYGQTWGGSWFPDGRRLAYSHEDRLVIHDRHTGNERVFRSPRKGRLVRTPAVSPDGRRVMFQVSRDGAWMLELADGSMRRVLEDRTAEEFTWAPDGRRVAYHSRQSGAWGVWVMAPR